MASKALLSKIITAIHKVDHRECYTAFVFGQVLRLGNNKKTRWTKLFDRKLLVAISSIFFFYLAVSTQLQVVRAVQNEVLLPFIARFLNSSRAHCIL